MKDEFIYDMLVARTRQYGESFDQASNELIQGGFDSKPVLRVLGRIRQEGRRAILLDNPPGVVDPSVRDEASLNGWYVGPVKGDVYWPRLLNKLESGSLRDVVDAIDMASTKVVANLADPGLTRLKKKGLVVGYVQSGKTANYTAVMAKAADAGYRLFIVLSGMHNNLRRQTQVRISDDLIDDDWAGLTSNDQDFGRVLRGSAMMSQRVRMIAVVKKNPSRLLSLRDWLRDIPEEIRARCPILILDDEADQATPNTRAAQDETSRINELVKQIWAESLTGTYVGYTATPFANVFIDPTDDDDMYPSDFIIDLPRPDEYYGAKRIFGLSGEHSDDDEGLDMVRRVPDSDSEDLLPPFKRAERLSFDPDLPDSLVDACTWFVVACAVRRSRGQTANHSSMLVHTTQYVGPHFTMQRRIESLVRTFRQEIENGQLDRFQASFEDEIDRAAEASELARPTWDQVKDVIGDVVECIRVIVDNGSSRDRLDYGRRDDDGRPLAETVIAIGGGTLSRGLTLEGLVVSYFTRVSNTYDTLLQMGRWFGYRPGYADLPRIWMTDQTREEFQFLAMVELEIREDMHRLEQMNASPKQFGIKVRSHPGRLAIVARNKMHFASAVRVSFSGQRHQTIVLHEHESKVIKNNLSAAKSLISKSRDKIGEPEIRGNNYLFADVSAEDIREFLASYTFHPSQGTLQSKHIVGWLARMAPDVGWNLVVAGRSTDEKLGVADLGLKSPVQTIGRAPLRNPGPGTANIKALMSPGDTVLDLDPDLVSIVKDKLEEYRPVRQEHADGRGLLVVYPISAHSRPRNVSLTLGTRRDMEAPGTLLGLGLVFPDVGYADVSEDGTYFAVTPDWEFSPDDSEEDEEPIDFEDSTLIDGEALAKRITS